MLRSVTWGTATTATLGVLVLSWCVTAATPRGRLLRVPKVYNALITSSEPLLPSRTEQATVGQVLYYPPHPHPHPHHTYPASSAPLVLPQVAAQSPPLYDPSLPLLPNQSPQPFVSLPPQQQQQQLQHSAAADPPLEVSFQPQEAAAAAADAHQQATPWPVVYASDVEQQQYTDGSQQQQLASQSESALEAASQSQREFQTVEEVAEPGEYRPPAAVHIDSVKNNRPSGQGIPDVPPPPLPVGRGGRKPQGRQPLPPGLLPL